MKQLFILIIFSFCTLKSLGQEKLPKGWDKIILEDKPAYMNTVTGEVRYTLPQKAAIKPTKEVAYDPTINHIVTQGETLSSISRKYGVSLAKLYQLNALENFDTLTVGQEIVVGYQEKGNVTTTEKAQYHTVQAGETLYRISKMYGLTVTSLKALNNLDTNVIAVGQNLKVQ